MLDKIGAVMGQIGEWDLRVTIAFGILAPFVFTQLITSVRSFLTSWEKGDSKTPAIAPYATPFAGNLFAFAFDTKKFLDNIIKSFGSNAPVRIRVLNQKLYYISGAESVLALFRASRDVTTTPSAILVLENAFGSPKSMRSVFTRDNTGINTQPLEGSNPLESHDRVFHIVHRTLHNNLSGTGLTDLASRFMSLLEAGLSKVDVGADWIEIPDLYSLIQHKVFEASTVAMCGPHIFDLNPDFTSDFWNFDTRLPGLFKGLPRWMIPKAFSVRDKLKNAVMKWHKYANEHFDWNDQELAKQEWEEYFGAKLMRDRQRDHGRVADMSMEGIAANDLGMIWGANANIVPIIGWCILDTLMRPKLLSQVRDEIATTLDSSKNDHPALVMSNILANPLLQSIYCEELRLRGSVMIQRVPIVSNFKIGSWKFPKHQMVIASSWHEQRDKKVWNEGPGQVHDVEDFWAERFLVYPNDLSSGPRKPSTVSKFTAQKRDANMGHKPKFTTEPVTGSFIPYGGGQKACPGRFYAKQEALGAMALFLTMFDIEPKEKDKFPQPNMNFFAFGVIPPKGAFPARIRRRRIAEVNAT